MAQYGEAGEVYAFVDRKPLQRIKDIHKIQEKGRVKS